MPLTHLLKPITINKLEVKNRILRTGHGTYYGKGSVSDDLIAYHEARARSGVGLTTLEVTCVHRSSVNNTLFGWDDEIIPGFRQDIHRDAPSWDEAVHAAVAWRAALAVRGRPAALVGLHRSQPLGIRAYLDDSGPD